MAIIIMGMHRSGTSLTTQILHKNGLFLGKPHELLESGFNNQEGYCENSKIIELNNDILKWLKGNWFNLPKSPVDFKSIPSSVLEQAKDIVKYFTSQRNEWGFKDPRTTVLYSFWKNILPTNHKIVFCFRHPSEVEKSLKKRYTNKNIDWRSLWVKYVRRGLVQTKNSNVHFVFYENYFSKPKKTVNNLLNFCELPIKNLDVINFNLRHNYNNNLFNDKATQIYNYYKSIYG